MTASNSKSKSLLRLEIRARLKTVSDVTRAGLSKQLCVRLTESEIWQSARSMLFFAPMADEPDLWPLLKDAADAGKQVALPRFDGEKKIYLACEIKNPEVDLQSGQFRIREPNIYCPVLPLNRLDLILVPGVAFDPHGRRLGRGKGFYDQLLADVRGMTCGVAFDEQIVADIPMEPHDIPLNCILTPTRWIEP